MVKIQLGKEVSTWSSIHGDQIILIFKKGNSCACIQKRFSLGLQGDQIILDSNFQERRLLCMFSAAIPVQGFTVYSLNTMHYGASPYPYPGWPLRPFLKGGGGADWAPPWFLRVLGGCGFKFW